MTINRWSGALALANSVIPGFLMDAQYQAYQGEVWRDDLLESYAPTREQAYMIHLSHNNGMPNERLLCALVSSTSATT